MSKKQLIGFALFAGLAVLCADSSRAQWVRTNGPSDSTVQSLAVSGSMLFAGTAHGIYRSTNNGDMWTRVRTSLPRTNITALVTMGTDLFASSMDSMGCSIVYRSTDSGATWLQASSKFPSPYECIGILTLCVKDSNLFAGGMCGGVFLSSNRGQSWNAIDSGIPAQPDFQTSALGAGSTNLFMKSDVGECSFGASTGVFCSSNNGAVWTKASDSIHQMDLWADETFAFTNLGSLSFAGGGTTVYQWDGGNSRWSVVGVVPGYGPIQSFATTGTHIFATASNPLNDRLFISSDSARTWKSVSTGLENASIYSNPFQLAVGDQYLFVGIIENGVWRRPLSEMIGSQSAVSEMPRSTTPPQARTYPNPFSQSTTISFTPEASGYADVSIVNLLGVEVARIFSGELAAGEHTFTWSTSETHVPHGMYECLIRMNGRVETLPVMLLR